MALLEGKDVMVGVIDVASDVIETPEQVADTIGRALQFVPKARIIPCTNCGLAPMSREVAEKKLQALAEGARIARERYRWKVWTCMNKKGHRKMAFLLNANLYLHAFKNGCNALSTANAHGDQGIPALDALQFVQSFDRDQGACGPNGVSQRNTGAIGVDLGGI